MTLIQVKRWAIEEDLAEDDLFISANVDEVNFLYLKSGFNFFFFLKQTHKIFMGR